VVGEREITFAPAPKQKKKPTGDSGRHDRRKEKDRRSASNNAFRGM
jgi:ribosome biogenesis protein ENP2